MNSCRYCKWYYKEHCSNGLSDKCTEMVWEDDSCEQFEEAEIND